MLPRTWCRLGTIRRYTFAEIVRSFAVCLLVLALGLFALTSVRLIHKGLNVIQLRGAAVAMAVSFFPYLLPFAFMTSLVMAFGRLSADNEILAMRSVGIHPGRLLAPVVLCGLALGGTAFFFNASLVPRFQRGLESMELDVFRGFLRKLQALPTRIISLPCYDLFIGRADANCCRDIVLFHNRAGKVLEIVRAEELRIRLMPERGGAQLELRNCVVVSPNEHPPKDLRQLSLASLSRFVDLALHSRSRKLNPGLLGLNELVAKSGEIRASLQSYPELLENPKKALRKAQKQINRVLTAYNTARVNHQKLAEAHEIETYRLKGLERRAAVLKQELKRPDAPRDTTAALKRVEARAEEARASLRRQADALQEAETSLDVLEKEQQDLFARSQLARLQRTSARVVTEIHHRLALSLAPLVLGLVAVPLGMAVTRRGFLAAFAVSFAFALFVYYPLSLLGDLLSRYTQISPGVFVWLPNAVALLVGLALLMRAFRR